MKKLLLVLLVISLVLVNFAGCGGQSSTSDVGDSASAEPIVIQFPIVDTMDTSLGQACTLFKEYVEKESNGAMQVSMLPNGQYGGERQAVEAVALGMLQMTVPTSAVLTTYSDNWMILDMPFLFNSKEASYAAVDGELGERLNAELPANGLICLGFGDNGFRHVSNNVRPINVPDDMKGIKIRVMESPVYISMFKLLGANPVPMSFSEVYTALQQGTVDAEENGPVMVAQTKFNEVQKYYSLTKHVCSITAVIVSKTWFEGLSEENQKIIKDGVKTYLVDEQRKIETQLAEECLQNLKDEGMVVNEVSPENLQKFRDAMQPIYAEYSDRIDPELYDIIEKYNNENS
jgi:tripartite ATP-independent transporter DctP family solute receptor